MIRSTPAWPAIFLVVFSLALLPLSPLAAQDSGGDEGAPTSADEQRVDEEEAEFRRRMELGEGDEDELPDDIPLPDIVDVDPIEGPDDGLPPQSRDHIEAELTKLIIENGRWSPEDAERPAPYTPSEAAQADPGLEEQEREAWEEQVAAYHERERAAFEQAGGAAGQGAGDGAGPGSAAGSGAGSGSGNGSGSGSGTGGGQAGPSSGGGVSGDEERAPEGEPFSALEFLGGASGDEETDDDAPEDAAPGPGQPGATGGTARDTGTNQGGERASSEEGEAVEAATPRQPEPGTAQAADEAEAPQEPREGGAESPSSEEASVTIQADEENPPDSSTELPDASVPPGSVPVEAFEGLFESAEPGSSGQAESTENRSGETAPDDTREAGSPPSESEATASPPAPPSFFDWLFGLFGGDDDEEPDVGSEDTGTGD